MNTLLLHSHTPHFLLQPCNLNHLGLNELSEITLVISFLQIWQTNSPSGIPCAKMYFRAYQTSSEMDLSYPGDGHYKGSSMIYCSTFCWRGHLSIRKLLLYFAVWSFYGHSCNLTVVMSVVTDDYYNFTWHYLVQHAHSSTSQSLYRL